MGKSFNRHFCRFQQKASKYSYSSLLQSDFLLNALTSSLLGVLCGIKASLTAKSLCLAALLQFVWIFTLNLTLTQNSRCLLNLWHGRIYRRLFQDSEHQDFDSGMHNTTHCAAETNLCSCIRFVYSPHSFFEQNQHLEKSALLLFSRVRPQSTVRITFHSASRVAFLWKTQDEKAPKGINRQPLFTLFSHCTEVDDALLQWKNLFAAATLSVIDWFVKSNYSEQIFFCVKCTHTRHPTCNPFTPLTLQKLLLTHQLACQWHRRNFQEQIIRTRQRNLGP